MPTLQQNKPTEKPPLASATAAIIERMKAFNPRHYCINMDGENDAAIREHNIAMMTR